MEKRFLAQFSLADRRTPRSEVAEGRTGLEPEMEKVSISKSGYLPRYEIRVVQILGIKVVTVVNHQLCATVPGAL